MAFNKTEYIWMNGKLVKWDDAKIHVLSHVAHYGSSVFEGQRAYMTDRGPALFRLTEHTKRLFDSAKIYRMEIPFTIEELDQAIIDLVAVNKLDSCYVRPLAYRGYNNLGVDGTKCPIEVAIAAWPWTAYLGADALEKGVSVCVSSWTRFAPNTLPAMAKSGANYANSQLIKMEAMRLGFAEGIALDVHGFVSEGTAQNIFMVRKGELITPPLSASILPGLTRDTVITIARDFGFTVREENIVREALYVADEVFFTGSAVEVSPIASIDGIEIGSGARGPITEKIQKAFFDIVGGRTEDKFGWLTYVKEKVSKEAKVTA